MRLSSGQHANFRDRKKLHRVQIRKSRVRRLTPFFGQFSQFGPRRKKSRPGRQDPIFWYRFFHKPKEKAAAATTSALDITIWTARPRQEQLQHGHGLDTTTIQLPFMRSRCFILRLLNDSFLVLRTSSGTHEN